MIDYDAFIQSISQEYGNILNIIEEKLFIQTVTFADNGQLEDAMSIAKDALTIYKYSNSSYAVLYLLGMICQIYIDKNELEMAEIVFKTGMEIIEDGKQCNENKSTYMNDIDAFLDLKIQLKKQ